MEGAGDSFHFWPRRIWAQKENAIGYDGLTDAQGISLFVSKERYQENHEDLHYLGISDWRCVLELKTSSRIAEEFRKSFSASLGGSSRDSIRTTPLH